MAQTKAKPCSANSRREVPQLVPDGDVVPQQAVALVGDAADAAVDPVGELVPAAPGSRRCTPRSRAGPRSGARWTKWSKAVHGAGRARPRSRHSPHSVDARHACSSYRSGPLLGARARPLTRLGHLGQLAELVARRTPGGGAGSPRRRTGCRSARRARRSGRRAPGTSRSRSGRCCCRRTPGRAAAPARPACSRRARCRCRSARRRTGRASSRPPRPPRRAPAPRGGPSTGRRGSRGRRCRSRGRAGSPPGSRWSPRPPAPRRRRTGPGSRRCPSACLSRRAALKGRAEGPRPAASPARPPGRSPAVEGHQHRAHHPAGHLVLQATGDHAVLLVGREASISTKASMRVMVWPDSSALELALEDQDRDAAGGEAVADHRHVEQLGLAELDGVDDHARRPRTRRGGSRGGRLAPPGWTAGWSTAGLRSARSTRVSSGIRGGRRPVAVDPAADGGVVVRRHPRAGLVECVEDGHGLGHDAGDQHRRAGLDGLRLQWPAPPPAARRGGPRATGTRRAAAACRARDRRVSR